MARIKLPDELKKAISQMPEREKDKLLFRLIAKEPALVKQLSFKLLEDGETTDERRADVKDFIERCMKSMVRSYYSPGYLLLDMRHISGRITDHVKTTKDKYGEVELNFYLLIRSLELFGGKTKQAQARRARTFNSYVVKRTIKLINLVGKMHEDYALDFYEDMKKLAKLIRTQPTMMDMAKNLGLDLRLLEGA